MGRFQWKKGIKIRFVVLWFVPLAFLLFVCPFIVNYQQSVSPVISTSETSGNNAVLLTAEDLKNALGKSDGFLAATRKNRGKTTDSATCVVDPGVTECGNAGFAAFLLYTLDHILFCRALGINRPTVFWRACRSGCSKDPRVNSWDWYFEPVNRGLELEVENVFCILRPDGAPLDVRTTIDNSFKKRTGIEGFEFGGVITTQERLRVDKLIHQYAVPNSRIKEKVEMFYQQYLAGFNVLGVHVRGTDHWMETSEKRLPSLMSWVKKAQSILETLPQPRKIFIASDNNEVVKKFVIFFGKETVSFTLADSSFLYYCPFRGEIPLASLYPNPEKLSCTGVCCPLSKTLGLTLFQSKICLFPYPIHNVMIPYSRPVALKPLPSGFRPVL